MSVPSSWKTLEIEQQCKFGFTLDKLKEFILWQSIKDYAYILHDKDIKDDGSPKEEHIHLMLRFTGAVPTSAILAKCNAVFGENVVRVEQLEKCKKWKSAIAYLTHENVTGKHIYDRKEVYSNYEFEKDIEDALSDGIRLNNLLNGIASGEVKAYNIHEFVSVTDYAKWKTKIDSAFTYRANILLTKGDRDMKCIYIQGDSGVGKTTYAKKICNEREYSYYVSSGSNDVLDGYGGQDAIILDDLRPSALSLADLLKMLDNNTSSSVKSRYRNKVLECRLIVITTVLPINEFFSQVFKEQPETARQLRRRCETYILMKRETMQLGAYDPQSDTYVFTPNLPNPCGGLSLARTLAVTVDSMRSMLKGTMSDTDLENALKALVKKSMSEKHMGDGFIKIDDFDTVDDWLKAISSKAVDDVLEGQLSLFDNI